jgi:hypothetical protein
MATDRQIAANRRNGALSRGPKTAAGKARSSRNALKHGLAIPITRDRATAQKIRRAARQMAPSAVGDSIRNAQIAAEANFELARVRAAFGSGRAHEHQPYVECWTRGYVQYWIRKICRADPHLGGARQAGSL